MAPRSVFSLEEDGARGLPRHISDARSRARRQCQPVSPLPSPGVTFARYRERVCTTATRTALCEP